MVTAIPDQAFMLILCSIGDIYTSRLVYISYDTSRRDVAEVQARGAKCPSVRAYASATSQANCCISESATEDLTCDSKSCMPM